MSHAWYYGCARTHMTNTGLMMAIAQFTTRSIVMYSVSGHSTQYGGVLVSSSQGRVSPQVVLGSFYGPRQIDSMRSLQNSSTGIVAGRHQSIIDVFV
jgi:hypothetical protein